MSCPVTQGASYEASTAAIGDHFTGGKRVTMTPAINVEEIDIADPTVSISDFQEDPTRSKGLRSRTPKSMLPTLLGATTPTHATGGYPGFGCSVPPGPKRYSENLQTPEPGRCLHFRGQKGCQVLVPLCRIIFTMIVAVASLSVIAYAYFRGQTLVHDKYYYIGFGLYGAVLMAHILMQAFFAALEHRKMQRLVREGEKKTIFSENEGLTTMEVRSMSDGADDISTVALQISAFEEDPDYLRECLESVKKLRYPNSKLKVILTVDGNQDKDLYHWNIFKRVFKDADPKLFRWDYNFHELPEGVDNSRNGVDDLTSIVQSNRCVCVMQKWGGKREVMYTSFKTVGDSVDYFQVCDSDTKLHANATLELVRVLDAQPDVGAVGGDVKILNEGDSIIAFLSSLRYWTAFNIERACQSYFGCVSCISGPLGLYRNSVLQQYLNLWSDQKFLGSVCTFGDDRHLTNRMLQFGYATKYTALAVCHTETPSQYLRWLNQQIRWSKSYFREWLFNALWWHKHHAWMTYESIIAGFFPYFVTGTVIAYCWSGDLWNVIWILCTIQAMGLLKGVFASILRRDPIMFFMSMYGMLYMTSLLPGKYFAMITINKKSWGTSGRKTILKNYNSLIPLIAWACILIPGIVYTIVVEVQKHKDSGMPQDKMMYLGLAFGSYIVYWLVILTCWKCCVQKHLNKKADITRTENDYGERSAASKSWATAFHAGHDDPTGTWKM